MLNVKILTTASMLPPGAWLVSATVNHAALIVQVLCAIAACFAIFVAILRVTDGASAEKQVRHDAASGNALRNRTLRQEF